MKGGNRILSETVHVATKPKPKLLNIVTFGAVGNGKMLNTRTIQAAIDACAQGGVVRVPAGIFLTGALFLKSDMTLELDKDAVLLGSAEPKDYPVMTYRAEGIDRLVIVGRPTDIRPIEGATLDFVVEVNRDQLGEIVQRVRDGRLRTDIGAVSFLEEAVATLNSTKRHAGKTTSAFAPEDEEGAAVSCRRTSRPRAAYGFLEWLVSMGGTQSVESYAQYATIQFIGGL